jgi:hypothetical protein
MAVPEPTPEQIASRATLKSFVERMRPKVRRMVGNIKSEWFGRPDEELKGWVERGRAIEEIKDSLGYRLILTQTHKEIAWAQSQLEICDPKDVVDFRCYLRSLRFLQDFILTTEKNADIAGTVLAGREEAIGRESLAFVKSAVPGDRY